MKDRSDNPSHHERTLLPRSYISLHILNMSLNKYTNFKSRTPTFIIIQKIFHFKIIFIYILRHGAWQIGFKIIFVYTLRRGAWQIGFKIISIYILRRWCLADRFFCTCRCDCFWLCSPITPPRGMLSSRCSRSTPSFSRCWLRCHPLYPLLQRPC